MTHTEVIAAQLRELVAAHEATMSEIIAVKPEAANGRSDGRRVRYVKAETAAAVLRDVLALLDDDSATEG